VKLRVGEWVVLVGSALIAAFAVVVGVLIYLKPPPVLHRQVESAAGRAGEAVYRREACGSCHKISENGATYGPGLDGVGSRRSARWLDEYLKRPREGVGDKPYRLKMPSYAHLKDSELAGLVAYLQGLRAVDAAGRLVEPPPSQAAEGRR
jgi:cbb3-type cytochrome oxidase cytochrome c subunit